MVALREGKRGISASSTLKKKVIILHPFVPYNALAAVKERDLRVSLYQKASLWEHLELLYASLFHHMHEYEGDFSLAPNKSGSKHRVNFKLGKSKTDMFNII